MPERDMVVGWFCFSCFSTKFQSVLKTAIWNCRKHSKCGCLQNWVLWFGRVKVGGKDLRASDKSSKPAGTASEALKMFNSRKVSSKSLSSKDKTSSPVNTARKSLTNFNGTKVLSKTATGHDKTSSPVNNARGSLTRFNGTKVLGKTAVGHDSASRPMGTARGSVTRFNGTPISSKTARGVNAASGPIGSAISAIKNFMSLPNLISKTVQVIHKAITGKATGSTGTDGNPIMVNDQEGPLFRELVKYPGSAPFIPHGRDVILDAPKGTKVIPAGLTARMYNIPQYANGTIDPNSSVLDAAQMVSDATSATPVTMTSSMVDNSKELKNMLAKFDSVLTIMSQLLGINVDQLQAIRSGAFDKQSFYRQQALDQALADSQRT